MYNKFLNWRIKLDKKFNAKDKSISFVNCYCRNIFYLMLGGCCCYQWHFIVNDSQTFIPSHILFLRSTIKIIYVECDIFFFFFFTFVYYFIYRIQIGEVLLMLALCFMNVKGSIMINFIYYVVRWNNRSKVLSKCDNVV